MIVVASFQGTSTVGRHFSSWSTYLWFFFAYPRWEEGVKKSVSAMTLCSGLQLCLAFTTASSPCGTSSSSASSLQATVNLNREARSTMAMWEVSRSEVTGTFHSASSTQYFWPHLLSGLLTSTIPNRLSDARTTTTSLRHGATVQRLWLYTDTYL